MKQKRKLPGETSVFDIGVPILGLLIWALPNLIFNKTKTTIKRNSSFFIISAT